MWTQSSASQTQKHKEHMWPSLSQRKGFLFVSFFSLELGSLLQSTNDKGLGWICNEHLKLRSGMSCVNVRVWNAMCSCACSLVPVTAYNKLQFTQARERFASNKESRSWLALSPTLASDSNPAPSCKKYPGANGLPALRWSLWEHSRRWCTCCTAYHPV